jgi:hypothetical protein
MAHPMIALDDALQSHQEAVAVVVIMVDGEAGVASRGDMVEGAWELNAQGSRHGSKIICLILDFKT